MDIFEIFSPMFTREGADVHFPVMMWIVSISISPLRVYTTDITKVGGIGL